MKYTALALLLLATPAAAQSPLEFLQQTAAPIEVGKGKGKPRSNHPIVAEAQRHVGARWRGRQWCQIFVNHVLRNSGYRPTGSNRAASILALPRTSPRPGVLAYWPSHSAILVSVNGNTGTFVSGNWSRRVSVHTYQISRVHAFVQPQT